MAFDTAVIQWRERIVDDLQTQGWATMADFYNPVQMQTLAAECHVEWEEGAFHRAGIGKGAGRQAHSEQRQDYISWLDPSTRSLAQSHYFQQMEQLRLAVNQRLFAGLHELEAHFAIYPPNAAYLKHLDQFQGDDTRVLTVILYLNGDWQDEDGGQLRLYLDGRSVTPSLDITPTGGTLVAFWSAQFWHEVLPARRDRMSITGWFRRRSLTAF